MFQTPSENLVNRGYVDKKWNGPTHAFKHTKVERKIFHQDHKTIEY